MRYDDPEAEASARAQLTDWRITPGLMEQTAEAHFMHCLPVRRGVVVDDSVIDSDRTLHLEQAEFRLHAQKAILSWLWSEVNAE